MTVVRADEIRVAAGPAGPAGPAGDSDLAALADLSPEAVRRMGPEELGSLAGTLRRFLVESVAATGGHLGSNLGAVELALAVHRVFDSPTDPVVWDTGHQAYVHKILTGRAATFAGLRQAGGLSGYPNRAESPHDVVENSHASTALSYADGLARARDLRGATHHVVAVVGDGALTGGLAYEALNNIGTGRRRVVVVLNDNGRSYAPTISPLTTAAASPLVARSANGPAAPDRPTARSANGPAATAKPLVAGDADGLPAQTSAAFFSSLGFAYDGPIDGHDVAAMEAALRRAAGQGGPVVVHVHTQKGRGYAPAETDAEKCLHDVSPFDPATGRPRPKSAASSYTEAFGTALIAEACARPEVVAVTAAMPGPTGLLPFAARFPDRFVDVGIAEQHAVTAAAGMAMGGLRPVVAIYSTFLNRAWDQLYHDVGLHRLPVVFCLDRAGVTGDDGPSHHGLLDLALLSKVPGMTLLVPSSYEEVAVMLHEALDVVDGPVAIRWPKTPARHADVVGTGLSARAVVAAGPGRPDVCFVGLGKLVEACERAAELLGARGIGVSVWDARVATPLDPAMVADAGRHRVVVTAEDGVAEGGVGSAIAGALRCSGTGGTAPHVVARGLPVAYLPHGKADDILRAHGLDGPGLARSALGALGVEG